MELQNASPERAKLFDCSRCPAATQKARRCREDREDFSSEDNSLFPIYIEKGGNLYSYCPGKATWDSSLYGLYQSLVICSETGHMLESGALVDQSDWWVDLLSWFLPYYSDARFYSRARAVLGDDKGGTKSADTKIRGKGR